MRSFHISAMVCVLVCACLAPWADAATVAYEGFSYAPGSDLLGQSGGSGFSTPWTAGVFNASSFTNYDVAGGSLQFSPLLTSGGSATTDATSVIAGLTRSFATPLGADGTTAYLSVLLRPEDALTPSGFFGIYLDGFVPNFDPNIPGEPDLFIGKPGGGATGNYVVERRGGLGQVDSGVSAVVGETALLVLKAEFLAGNDRFTLYVNPTPGGSEPATGAVKSDLDLGTVSGLAIYSMGAFSIDEIRLGNTFADVTPVSPIVVPLPSAAYGGLALLAAAALPKLARRWRTSK